MGIYLQNRTDVCGKASRRYSLIVVALLGLLEQLLRSLVSKIIAENACKLQCVKKAV